MAQDTIAELERARALAEYWKAKYRAAHERCEQLRAIVKEDYPMPALERETAEVDF